MNEFWDQRYATTEYVYGKTPNLFYQKQLEQIKPGTILFPAEGEGRNAVYAATQGWKVTAFDSSIEGQKKAMQLSNENNVSINYLVKSYDEVDFPENSFDCLVLIFAHLSGPKRSMIHKKLVSYLKPGGTLLMEAFSKAQINFKSGGPRDMDALYSLDEMKSDFSDLQILSLSQTVKELYEGSYHSGNASVIRLVATK